MSQEKRPHGAAGEQHRGEYADKLNIPQAPEIDKDTRPCCMADLTLEEFRSIADMVRGYNRRHPLRYDPREFQGAYYYERCFLSCLIAGAAIPPGIIPDILLIPRHRVILKAIRELSETGIQGNLKALTTWLGKTGTLKKAGGEEYVREIKGIIGIPSALSEFILEIRRLALERLP